MSSAPAGRGPCFLRLVPRLHLIPHTQLPHVVSLLLRWAWKVIFGVGFGREVEAMYSAADRDCTAGTKNDEKDDKRSIEVTAIICTHVGGRWLNSNEGTFMSLE